jgi:hypothetical protein
MNGEPDAQLRAIQPEIAKNFDAHHHGAVSHHNEAFSDLLKAAYIRAGLYLLAAGELSD